MIGSITNVKSEPLSQLLFRDKLLTTMDLERSYVSQLCQRSGMATRLLLLASGVLFSASQTRAQNAKALARLYGTVVDARTQLPVLDAEIISLADGRSVRSDSLGVYSFDQLPPGIMKFMVRAARFPMATFSIAFALGEQFKHNIVLLDSAGRNAQVGRGPQALPEVAVTGVAVSPRFADFERHRRTGGGQYLTKDDLDKGNFGNLQDAMRGLRGVLLACGGGNGWNDFGDWRYGWRKPLR